MKTLLITLEYPPQIGGIASYVFNVAAHLPSEEVVVYAPRMKEDKEFDEKNGWKVIRKKPEFSFLWPKWLRLLWQVWRIVKRDQIKMIQVHHVLPVGYVAYAVKKILGVPYTLFFHGTDVEIGTRSWFKRKMVTMVCESAAIIVVNSEFLKNKLLERVERVEGKIVILNPCPGEQFFQLVQPERLSSLKSQLALEGKKVILTVARMSEGKGYPRLVRLLPQILQRVPNLVWLVIGDGPKKKVVIDLVQKYYLQNVTRFMGTVPYEELPRYYQLADLFVLLTHPDESAEEGWGTAFLEASASGIPVVAGRVGGVEESVQNLVTGLVVDVYQDESIIAAVSDLLRKEDYAKKMGEAGRVRAGKEFRWEREVRKINSMRIYE